MSDDDETTEGRIVKALYGITDLWDEMLLPTARRTGSRSGGVLLDDTDDSAADTPRTIQVIDIRLAVMHALRGWCQVIVEDHNVHHGIPNGTDVPGMVTFLLRWRTQLADHDAADTILEELRDCHTAVRNCARPYRRTSMSLGPCPLTTQHPDTSDKAPCTGTVRTCEGDAEAESWAQCTVCRERGVAAWWERQMFPEVTEDQQQDRTVTAQEIVTLAHKDFGRAITQQAVWQWTHRRTLPPVDPKARPLRYRLDDVMVVLARKVG